MARWLAIAVDENGDVKTAMVNDSDGINFPFGDHGAICERMEVDELTSIVEMPDGDFRPLVTDCSADTEAPMQFIDL
jgi:hypothetical protein